MKVGIDARFLTHPQMGGFKTYTENLVNALSRVDSSNEYIIYVDRQPRESELFQNDNFSYRVVNGILPIIGMPLREQFRLRRQILKDQPDLVHFLCNTASVNLPSNYVVTLHDTIQVEDNLRVQSLRNYSNFKNKLITTYSRWAILHSIRKADKVITVSKFESDRIHEQMGIDREKICVTHLAPNPIYTQADPDVKAKWRKEIVRKFNITGSFVLGVGSEPRKNIPLLIEAFSQLDTSFCDINLVLVVADTESRNRFCQLVTKQNLDDRVIILASMPPKDLVVLFNLAELFVFPSKRESFGLPPLEALACGAPVIASKNSSIPEVVGNAAVLVDPISGESLAEAMFEILTDASIRVELTQKGFKRVKSFSWEKCAHRTIRVYKEVYENSRKEIN